MIEMGKKSRASGQVDLIPPVDSGHPGPVPGLQVVINHFDAAFRAAYDGAKPTWGAKPGAQLKRLVAAHSVAEVTARIDRMFGGGLDWPAPPYTVDTLVRHFDRLVPTGAARRKLSPSEIASGNWRPKS